MLLCTVTQTTRIVFVVVGLHIISVELLVLRHCAVFVFEINVRAVRQLATKEHIIKRISK